MVGRCHQEHRRVIGSFEGTIHDVDLEPGSLVARVAGGVAHPSMSHHHQGIDALGDGLRVTGRARIDDLVEAIEVADHPFALGVQWHPEADPTSGVIAGFVRATAPRAATTVSRGS